ncbi:hypothetical protein F5Y16DRAFT_122337 [Xylariaceae sp. FL0255]|nr:hypothetical protein F5Y16DRAFT_122337 [Xylariaceae sp. FL0255]
MQEGTASSTTHSRESSQAQVEESATSSPPLLPANSQSAQSNRTCDLLIKSQGAKELHTSQQVHSVQKSLDLEQHLYSLEQSRVQQSVGQQPQTTHPADIQNRFPKFGNPLQLSSSANGQTAWGSQVAPAEANPTALYGSSIWANAYQTQPVRNINWTVPAAQLPHSSANSHRSGSNPAVPPQRMPTNILPYRSLQVLTSSTVTPYNHNRAAPSQCMSINLLQYYSLPILTSSAATPYNPSRINIATTPTHNLNHINHSSATQYTMSNMIPHTAMSRPQDPMFSTSVWITNLPPDVTYPDLFAALINTGKIFALVIHQPETMTTHANITVAKTKRTAFTAATNPNWRVHADTADDPSTAQASESNRQIGTPRLPKSTCAAKIVFWSTVGRVNLLARAHAGGFTVGNYVPDVRDNRELTSPQPNSTCSRVLIIKGPETIVNEDHLRRFFEQFCYFDLECIRLLQRQAPVDAEVADAQGGKAHPGQGGEGKRGFNELEQMLSLIRLGIADTTGMNTQAGGMAGTVGGNSGGTGTGVGNHPLNRSDAVIATVEFRFASFRKQAETAYNSIVRQKGRHDLSAHEQALWAKVEAKFGLDPCEPIV